jgi:hypothetical protein
MERKNKTELNTENDESDQEIEELKPQDPADDDALIPYHTKQASIAMLYLLFFSALMFTLPFGAFFGVRWALFEYYDIDGFQNTCWSVIASVVTVNAVIAMYAIMGFREAKREEETVKLYAASKDKQN